MRALAVLAFLLLQGPGRALRRTQYFLDSADAAAIRRWLPSGLFHGVTTNPLILQRAGLPCDEPTIARLHQLCIDEFGLQVFMAQAWGSSAEELVKCGKRLSLLNRHRQSLVVKLPLTEEGVQAASVLKRQQIPICMTACYAAHQVLSSCALGADYVAPYLGRMGDAGVDAMETVAKMQAIAEAQSGTGSSETRVLVASIRHANQMAELAALGCDTFTFSPNVAEQLFGEALTTMATAEFEDAAARTPDSAPEEAPSTAAGSSPGSFVEAFQQLQTELSEAVSGPRPSAASKAPAEEATPEASQAAGAYQSIVEQLRSAAAEAFPEAEAKPEEVGKSPPLQASAGKEPPRPAANDRGEDENAVEEEHFDETLEELGGEAWFVQDGPPQGAA